MNMNEPITFQEIFNRGWQAFIVEGKPRCVDGRDECVYYDSVTKHGCIIGLPLIERLKDDPEELQELEDSDGLASEIANKYSGYFAEEVLNDPEKLNHMQTRLHDNLSKHLTTKEREERFREIAERYNLEVPEHATP